MGKRTKKENYFVADFETHGEKFYDLHGYTKVYGWGIMNVGTETYQWGHELSDFIKVVSSFKEQTVIYFHNLTFDVSFIVSFLFSIGEENEIKEYAISSGFHSYYYLKYKNVTFKDSYKVVPTKLSNVAKFFGLKKLEEKIDHTILRDVYHTMTDLEKEYLHADCLIVSRLVGYLLKNNMSKLTVGANAYNEWCKTLNGNVKFYFPPLTAEFDEYCRPAYRGGVSLVNEKFIGQALTSVYGADRRSMYPTEMLYQRLPYGYGVTVDGYLPPHQHKFMIYELLINFDLKEGYQPFIQKKHSRTGEHFLKTSDFELLHMFATDIDMITIKENYNISEIKYIKTTCFETVNGLFTKHIRKWEKIKNASDKNTDFNYDWAKYMMNTVSGKPGQRLKTDTVKHFMSEDGVVKFGVDGVDEQESKYLPLSIAITSYGRRNLFSIINQNRDTFVYCDTDSVYCTEPIKGIGEDNGNFGEWEKDKDIVWAKFLRPKCYFLRLANGSKKVKVAGVPDEAKEELEEDTFNYLWSTTKKLKKRTVKGGVILAEEEFTIKPIL